jgi:hypothetical protein
MSLFQKRQYRAIARTINSSHLSHNERNLIVSAFVRMLLEDNHNFSPTKFREACDETSNFSMEV